jgi:hypothetical protein
MTAPTSLQEQHVTTTDPDAARIRDERDQLRQRLAAFARLVDTAELGGATVMRVDDIRRALKIPAGRGGRR